MTLCAAKTILFPVISIVRASFTDFACNFCDHKKKITNISYKCLRCVCVSFLTWNPISTSEHLRGSVLCRDKEGFACKSVKKIAISVFYDTSRTTRSSLVLSRATLAKTYPRQIKPKWVKSLSFTTIWCWKAEKSLLSFNH